MSLILAASGPLDFLKPVGDVLRWPFELVLGTLFRAFSAVPPLHAIGAYGLAIILLTVMVKLLLFPLFQKQLTMTKKTQAEQRKIAPEMAELRRRYKKDATRLNQEMMALYKKHGINPFGQLAGCLPTLAQMPILIGLYQAIFQHKFLPEHGSTMFLGLDLSHHASLSHPDVLWILPLLAGASTYVQSKMFTPPAPPGGEQDPQAAQMASVGRSMSVMMPLLITFFAFQPYALQGLVLYWIVSNLFSIGQQYTVNGWGSLPILGSKGAATTPAGGGSASSIEGSRPESAAKARARARSNSGSRRNPRR